MRTCLSTVARLCLCVALGLVVLLAPARADAAAPVTSTRIWLIDIGGGSLGCGDAAKPVRVAIAPTGAPLRASINRLLAIRSRTFRGLYNPLYASRLRVGSASVVRGLATVNLVGRMTTGGVCDTPRVIAQLHRTALQFPTVTRVRFRVNGVRLEDFLSER